MMRPIMAAMAVAALCAACGSPAAREPRPRSWTLGPAVVEIDGGKQFSVSYLPEERAALMTFLRAIPSSPRAETSAPPTPLEWRFAAEEAAPQGCAPATLERIDDERWRASYACGR